LKKYIADGARTITLQEVFKRFRGMCDSSLSLSLLYSQITWCSELGNLPGSRPWVQSLPRTARESTMGRKEVQHH